MWNSHKLEIYGVVAGRSRSDPSFLISLSSDAHLCHLRQKVSECTGISVTSLSLHHPNAELDQQDDADLKAAVWDLGLWNSPHINGPGKIKDYLRNLDKPVIHVIAADWESYDILKLEALRIHHWGKDLVQHDFKGEAVDWIEFNAHNLSTIIGYANNLTKILVRDGFDELYTNLEVIGPQGFHLIGQSGAGNTVELLYVFVRCLAEKRPVILQGEPDDYYVFSEHGTTKYQCGELLHEEPLHGASPLLALVDPSGVRDMKPATAFARMSVLVVVSSSPTHVGRSYWSKQSNIKTLVRSRWTDQEVRNLELLLGLLPGSLTGPMEKYGPCIRDLLSLSKGFLSEMRLESEIRIGAFATAATLLQKKILELADLPEKSSKVVFVQPDESSLEIMRPYIPTAFITGIVAEAISILDLQEQTTFFRILASYPTTRPAAGSLFENVVHQRLCADSGEVFPCEQWSVARAPKEIHSAEQQWKAGVKGDFYWRPPTPNWSGIDSVLYDSQSNSFFALQITISSKHTQPWDGIKMAMKKLKRKGAKWYFLFVTSSSQEAEALLSTLREAPSNPAVKANGAVVIKEVGVASRYLG